MATNIVDKQSEVIKARTQLPANSAASVFGVHLSAQAVFRLDTHQMANAIRLCL